MQLLPQSLAEALVARQKYWLVRFEKLKVGIVEFTC